MDNVVLIGLDGGASEAKAHAVSCDSLETPTSFTLQPESAARVYRSLPAFTPLPVAEQIAQRDAGLAQLGEYEREQGALFIAAAAEAIIDVARQCAAKRVLVGAGMPGLKTADRRGIAAINNGPRMPDYLDQLESRLTDADLELRAPIAELGSDADYCGLGEQYAADGLFRDVENAYYVGCGTGIADAMKLRGELVPFDDCKSWIQKSWQMPSALGPTFEKLVSASSLNDVYARLKRGTEKRRHGGTEKKRHGGEQADAGGTAVSAVFDDGDATGSLVVDQFPEQAAADGDPLAVAWLDTAALILAELIFERIRTIKNGRADAPHRGETYDALEMNHEYRGIVLERVVIGQRLGQVYGDTRFRNLFTDHVDRYLAGMIAACGDAQLAARTLDSEALRAGRLCASALRAAPALGAAIAAVRAHAARSAAPPPDP